MQVENMSGHELKLMVDTMIAQGREHGALVGDITGIQVQLFDSDAGFIKAGFDVPEEATNEQS